VETGSPVDEVVERLGAICEELGEMAFDTLREASQCAREDSVAAGALVDSEKRLTRARRSVEKAISVLKDRSLEPEDY